MSEGPAKAPLPLLELRHGLPVVVTTRRSLREMADRIAAGTGPVAIDAERASGYRYSQRAYLVQLARDGAGSALIDPVPFGGVPNDVLRPLAEAIGDTEWIIHAASQDLQCLAELGLTPRVLFDTELAGRLLNLPKVGLATLVEELLGLRMRKEHSAVDWSKRPMPRSWLDYAALDVEPLIELRGILADQLETAGKAEWARQEFAYWATLPFPGPRADPWRRTSGIHRVRGRRGLALVREIWTARDNRARETDTASGRLLPDAAIIDIAVAAPKSERDLGRLPSLQRSKTRRMIPMVWAAVGRVAAMTERELPSVSPRTDAPPHPRVWANKNPEAADRLKVCRETVTGIAAEHNLPAENLLSPDAVRRLAWQPDRPIDAASVGRQLAASTARQWQVELTAAGLAAALAPWT
jgi:ribonuclease D